MMATPSNTIHVPQTEPGSYNKNRPAGKLLQAQTLAVAAMQRPAMLSWAAVRGPQC